ncbi:glycosyltransferase [Ulvibacterium sp.]|uniref:glycosyltransferase n=1 Tax=Ulvibacterium sp. TaxID=2665914 RepID=UPI003BA8934E
MKVAVVHYWFITRRGGEKVVESILQIFPQADIYTLFYDRGSYGNHIDKHNVYTSVLDKRWLRKYYQKLFPLYPMGIRSLKLRQDYDLIISSESGPAKGINIPNNCPHICYIHSPMRYCWGFTQEYLNSMSKLARPVASFFFKLLREWDKSTVNNVSYYVANSYNVANRVKKYYGKSSYVIQPPIALSLFDRPLTKQKGEFYLSFGAITPYKRIDLLVDTFNKNGKRLIVIGDGSEKKKLEAKANENISFLGNLKWAEIETILYKTKALVFPGEEDFGMIPLEVMTYGVPVLAFKKGGALETIVENLESIEESSGLFFEMQTSRAIQKCIDKFETIKDGFDKEWIRNHTRRFGEDNFIKKFKLFLKEKT